MCDFRTGFKPPEMVKTRPVVVVSGKRTGVCTVVPLSTTEPHPVEPWHHLLDKHSLPLPFQAKPTWAKCDMVTTVSLERLDRVLIGRDTAGKRPYVAHKVNAVDLLAIERGLIHALCLKHLTILANAADTLTVPLRGLVRLRATAAKTPTWRNQATASCVRPGCKAGSLRFWSL